LVPTLSGAKRDWTLTAPIHPRFVLKFVRYGS